MTHERFDLRGLDDRELLDGLLKLHQTSAEVMADLLCHLAEVERRRLHLKKATASIFKYAVVVLGCTEDEAWRRVTAAQTAARFPVIFERVARGQLTLTAVYLLRDVLTKTNHVEVLDEAMHKTRKEIEELKARLAPKPDVKTRLTPVAERLRPVEVVTGEVARSTAASVPQGLTLNLGLPVATTGAPSIVASAGLPETDCSATPVSPPEPKRPERARLTPLSPTRWMLTLTIGTEAERALRRAGDLTPGGDLARVVERAVIEYAEKLEARKYAKLRGRGRRSATDEALSPTAPARSSEAESAPVTSPTARGSRTTVRSSGEATPNSTTRNAAASGATISAPGPIALASGATTPAPGPIALASGATISAPGPIALASGATTQGFSPNDPAAGASAHDAADPTSASDAVTAVSAPARVPRAKQRLGRGPGAARAPSHRPHIPRAVIREVVERDGGRCGYVDPDTGRRCCETANLHIHHIVAYARGGRARASELGLRCASHNAYHAVLDFGAKHVAEAIARDRRRRASRRASSVRGPLAVDEAAFRLGDRSRDHSGSCPQPMGAAPPAPMSSPDSLRAPSA